MPVSGWPTRSSTTSRRSCAPSWMSWSSGRSTSRASTASCSPARATSIRPGTAATPAASVYDVNPEQDDLDLGIAHAAAEAGIPILGVCRELQVLNVAFGGTLVEDLPESAARHRDDGCGDLEWAWHPVAVAAGSRLRAEVDADAPCRSHQGTIEAVRALGAGLVATAVAETGWWRPSSTRACRSSRCSGTPRRRGRPRISRPPPSRCSPTSCTRGASPRAEDRAGGLLAGEAAEQVAAARGGVTAHQTLEATDVVLRVERVRRTRGLPTRDGLGELSRAPLSTRALSGATSSAAALSRSTRRTRPSTRHPRAGKRTAAGSRSRSRASAGRCRRSPRSAPACR